MALSAEKISELKQVIHSHLSQGDVQSKIKNAVAEVLGDSDGDFNEDQLLSMLRDKGVIEDVMGQLEFQPTTSSTHMESSYGAGFESYLGPGHGHQPKKATHFTNKDDKFMTALPTRKANIDPTRRYLYLQILGGKAFLEHLQEPDPLPGQPASTFTLHIHFRGQRFKTRPVACACEPDMEEGFLLELHAQSKGEASRMADGASVLALSDPVHMVLVKTDPDGASQVVSSHLLEWRSSLAAPSSRCTLGVELLGIGAENKVPVGLLEVRLELIPRLPEALGEDVVSAQIALEKSRQAERERLFLVYAKQWWREYLQIRHGHKDRLVKIFAQDENATNRPVCAYIQPLRAGRLLDTPRQAARFVSLLGYEKTSMVGGGMDRAELWSTMHSFLARNKGDCEDHAILLCCLLLGFGLDAYICVGTKSKGTPHTWVMTLSMEGKATFWEALTGHRYDHQPISPDDGPMLPNPKPPYPYKTVGCVFSHRAFFANCQPSDLVEHSFFHLQDESRWKAMSEDAIISVCAPGMTPRWPSQPPLCETTLDGALISNDLEQELRHLVTEHRRDQGLTTLWDDHLSFLLTPALAAYETERVTGVTCGNEEFQQAVRRAVPDGHTFKGYPIQFVHRNARRAFAACLKSPMCEEIVNCRGDHMRLAVRVRVYTYPESACATWVMLACKYKCVL